MLHIKSAKMWSDEGESKGRTDPWRAKCMEESIIQLMKAKKELKDDHNQQMIINLIGSTIGQCSKEFKIDFERRLNSTDSSTTKSAMITTWDEMSWEDVILQPFLKVNIVKVSEFLWANPKYY